MPNRRPTSSPEPWSQYEARTTFLRVPAFDWLNVKNGIKTEFRASGRGVTQLWNVTCPMPVVAYTVTRRGHDRRLMVLEETRQETLIAISQESLEREGFDTLEEFRRYWTIKTKRKFTPTRKVQVYRVRRWRSADMDEMGRRLLDRLYGEHLAS